MIEVEDSQESTEVKASYVASVTVEGLWGSSSTLRVNFHPDVNIVIGPNACGKTTLLNLIRSALQADVLSLIDIAFKKVIIKLRGFNGGSTHTLRVVPSASKISFYLSNKKLDIPINTFAADRYAPRIFRMKRDQLLGTLTKQLGLLAPIVWLPVSRRLPIADDDFDERHASSRGRIIESVDHRLGSLRRALASYRLGLNNRLNAEYKNFEREVLGSFLYNKQHDRFSITAVKDALPTAEEREQIVTAFDSAGLLDAKNAKKDRASFRSVRSCCK